MFSFIHAADLHLDSPLRGLAQHEHAPADLIRDAARCALENLVALALDESVSFVLLAGDIYDGKWKDSATGLFFRRQMLLLQKANIPVFLIKGNHDAQSVITREMSLPDNVFEFSSRNAETKLLQELVGDAPKVAVHGYSFPDRAVPENLSLSYPDAVTDHFNIGLLHTSLAGSINHDTYAPCSEDDLRAKEYDYWALGHIHQPSEISRAPWIVYSGNIQGRHINEQGPRGCYLVQVDRSARIAAKFHPLDIVRWQTLNIDLTLCDSWSDIDARCTKSLQKAVTAADGRLLAARLQLKGKTQMHAKLHFNPEDLNTQLLTLMQDVGDDKLWIEKVSIQTAPANTELNEQQDDLTQYIVDAINQGLIAKVSVPEQAKKLIDKLGKDSKEAILLNLEDPNHEELISDVTSIVTAALNVQEDAAE